MLAQVPRELTLGRSGLAGAVAAAVTLWALAGGALLLVIVAINIASVVGGIVARPFPGDFELTQIGIAICAFSFLPLTQMTGGNVSADIFTARAGPRVTAGLTAIGALLALIFAVLLLWRMFFGLLDQKTYSYVTAILQIPVWLAFVPILISLGLLAAAAGVNLTEELRKAGRPRL